MPYDPLMQGGPPAPARWWEQPQAPRGVQFTPPPPPQQPKQWYDQAMPRRPAQVGQTADPSNPDDPNAPKQPPSMYDMMLGLGRMTRPEYDKAIAGQGGYGVSPRDAGRVSPWAFLGSMGMPGGTGWGGGGAR